MDLDTVPFILLPPDCIATAVNNVAKKTNTNICFRYKSVPSKAAKQHAVSVGCTYHVFRSHRLGSMKLDTKASVVACLQSEQAALKHFCLFVCFPVSHSHSQLESRGLIFKSIRISGSHYSRCKQHYSCVHVGQARSCRPGGDSWEAQKPDMVCSTCKRNLTNSH